MDKRAVHEEMERARADFHDLVSQATDADLARPSNGTRWTNQQLLFHMLFGYLIIRALRNLVRMFGRLPDPVSRAWARLLNAATVPFDAVNFAGSWAGGSVLGPRAQAVLLDRVIAALQRRLAAETDDDLARGMYYPTRWDPFFDEIMTLAEIYRFPTRHFDFHRRQLTLTTHRE